MSTQKQGKLILDCIASSPDSTTLYGIANARSSYDPYNEYTILVKSNKSNPATVSDLQWTVVSIVKISETAYRHPAAGTVNCAVSGAEEFTAFFYDPAEYVMSGKNSVMGPVLFPVGVRFDSRKKEVEGGNSGWTDIQGSSLFFGEVKDGGKGLMQQSFYVGEEVVLLVTDELTTLIRFGVVDSGSRTLQLAGIWRKKDDGTYEKGALNDQFDRSSLGYQSGVIPSIGYTAARRIAYGDGHLYITEHEYRHVNTSDGRLTIYPFATRNAALNNPATEVVPVLESGMSNYVHTFFGVQGNGTYLGGLGYNSVALADTYEPQYAIQMIQNPSSSSSKKFVPPLQMTGADPHNGTHYPLSRFQSLGGHVPGQAPFAVIPMTDGLYSVALSGVGAIGATATTVNLTGPIEVLIMADEWVNTWPRVYRESNSSNISDVGPVVLYVVGAAAVVVSLGVFLWRRNRRKMKRYQRKKDEKTASMEGDGGGKAYIMGMIPETQTAPEAGIYVITSGNSQAGSSPSTFAASVAASSPQPSSAHTYQDEIQGLEFSSHPRPSVVTSVGDP
ncbi:hypothetical protein F5H01DRAFT_335572 [Linnemannia elongata]|nr:hypothetical protein F5H01DRAFT_335572 [Linnemannia elongata]